jgi:uncharacterized protein (DUF433 family)
MLTVGDKIATLLEAYAWFDWEDVQTRLVYARQSRNDQ